MSVNNLETPESGITLRTRKTPEGVTHQAEADLRALRERVSGARVVEPDGGFVCCSHCAQAFTAGRDAAIKAIEG